MSILPRFRNLALPKEVYSMPSQFNSHLRMIPKSVSVCMLSRFSRVWLFETLWTVAHQVPVSLGFSRQEYWSGLPCPATRNFPDLGLEPSSLLVSCIGRQVHYHEHHLGSPELPEKDHPPPNAIPLSNCHCCLSNVLANLQTHLKAKPNPLSFPHVSPPE